MSSGQALSQGRSSGDHFLGVRRQPELFVHNGSNHLLGVRFKPGAAACLLELRGAELADRFDLPSARFSELTDVVRDRVQPGARRGGPLLVSGRARAALWSALRRGFARARLPRVALSSG